MEFTKETNQGKHHITIISDCSVNITRLGLSKTIKYFIDIDTPFKKAMTRVNNVCNYDNEVFAYISDLEAQNL